MSRPAHRAGDYGTFDKIAERLKLDVDLAQREAARTLELRGLRFCVEFGTQNCVEKALDRLEQEGWTK
jgi:hypothetical protein